MRRPERFAALYAKDVFNPQHHRRAVDAIHRRDGAEAGAAMRAHAATAIATLPGKSS
jgi:DNA-binding GntR family transcriptional regulator